MSKEAFVCADDANFVSSWVLIAFADARVSSDPDTIVEASVEIVTDKTELECPFNSIDE